MSRGSLNVFSLPGISRKRLLRANWTPEAVPFAK